MEPEIIEKIASYNLILLDRYPPSFSYYKLSTGYADSKGANSSSDIVYAVYTTGGNQPEVGDRIYIDQASDLRFIPDGLLWYKVYDSSSSPLSLIRISTRGDVSAKDSL
jgi:hypothetical protein